MAFTPELGSLAEARSFHDELSFAPMADVSKARVCDWLSRMLTIRRAEEAIAAMVESTEAKCPCHLGIGQEAAAVGVADALRPTDRVFGAHRSHSHYLALGASLRQLMAEVLGKAEGCSSGMGGSMHLRAPAHGLIGTVPIVGATIPIAVGAALAAKLDRTGDVAVTFFGDGAVEEGVFHESLNMAASMGLPVLFVCENNLFSSHLHISLRQPSDRIARFGDAHHLPAVTLDGNDVVAISTELGQIVAAMRADSRPALVELVTYRWRGHVGHREDLDVGVDRRVDLGNWKRRDPIDRLAKAAVSHGLITDADVQMLADEVDAAVADAVEHARAAPYPPVSQLLGTVYPSLAGARP